MASARVRANCQVVCQLSALLSRNRPDDSYIVWIVETFPRKAEHTLLFDKLLSEVTVTVESWEPAPVDSDHHVHRPLGHHRHKSRYIPKFLEC